MDIKQTPKLDKKKKLFAVVALAATLILTVVVILILNTPQRSVASYCSAYKEENNKLASANGTTYGVKVFSHRSSNPADFVAAFSRLEQVAPDEIHADVKTLRQVFQKINDDPSQAISASLSGISAETSVKEWTVTNCKL